MIALIRDLELFKKYLITIHSKKYELSVCGQKDNLGNLTLDFIKKEVMNTKLILVYLLKKYRCNFIILIRGKLALQLKKLK